VRRRQLKKVITFQRAMTEKRWSVFREKNKVTPSVAAAGDTNPSYATLDTHTVLRLHAQIKQLAFKPVSSS